MSLPSFLSVHKVLKGFAAAFCYEVAPVGSMGQSYFYFTFRKEVLDVRGYWKEIVHSYFIYEEKRLFIRWPLIIVIIIIIIAVVHIVISFLIFIRRLVDISLNNRVFQSLLFFSEIIKYFRYIYIPLILINPIDIDLETTLEVIKSVLEI